MNSFFKTFSIALAAAAISFSCDDTIPSEELVPEDGAYTGTLLVAPGGANEFTLDEAKVEITVAGDMRSVDIKMLKAQFAGRMPQIDMTIPGIALLRKEGDNYSLTGDGIVPTVAGGAFPQYTISGFEGILSLKLPPQSSSAAPTLSFSMVCMGLPVTYNGYRNADK